MAELPTQQLSLKEQEALLKKIKGTILETQAILSGVIEPLPVRYFREAKDAFVSQDSETLTTKDKAIKLSTRDEPVLILGESGTGKELLARILHGERYGEFVAVNVCAVTDTLFESELFGHVKGAFTGADKEREGLIKQADGGTLFLDEIGDMPLPLQAKMLRVIQNRKYRRVGESSTRDVKCRIIAATHQDLHKMQQHSTFRLDLYQRLTAFKLTIKPLRQRPSDIPLYVGEDFAKFLDTLCESSYALSGNVRQLLNLKLRYEVFGSSDIGLEDLA